MTEGRRSRVTPKATKNNPPYFYKITGDQTMLEKTMIKINEMKAPVLSRVLR
jgi:mannose-1-phosphate guanylyltransferase